MEDRYQLTDQADTDLFEISLYLAHQGNIETAERFIDTVHQKLVRLADFPGIGRTRKELAPGLRSIPEGQYVIFYRTTSKGILVIRVLHGSREAKRIFGKPESEGDNGNDG
jgi:toxin ParE1/3/4